MRLSLEAVFGLVITVILLVVIGSASWTVIKTRLPKEIDDATLSAFDEIVRVLKDIESGEYDNKTIVVDIKEPYVILGFSRYQSIELEKLISDIHEKIAPVQFFPVLPTDTILSPCDIKKSCICICSYSEKKIPLFGANTLEPKSCHKKSCVEFDKINSLIGKNDFPSYKDYVFILPITGGINVYGTKEDVTIRYKQTSIKTKLAF